MGNTIVKNVVGEDDLCVVHPGGAVRQDSERQVSALKSWHSHVAQGGREDDVVGDDVVSENILNCREFCSSEHRANRSESVVSRNEDGVVGEIETRCVGSSKGNVEAKITGF